MKAPAILQAAHAAIGDRATERDQPDGERTARRTARIFNAIAGRQGIAELSEQDVWLLLASLKLARAQQGAFKLDDYIDGAAYVALAGECAAEGGAISEPAVVKATLYNDAVACLRDARHSLRRRNKRGSQR